MNLDDIKNNWNELNHENIQLPESVSDLKKAQHPIAKLKRNMGMEFILQMLTMLALPVYFRYQFSEDLQNVLLGVYAVFVLICAYYFYHFYLFYNRDLRSFNNSKDSLYELYYNLLLNIERYKSCGFLFIPFIIILAGMGSLDGAKNVDMQWSVLIANLKEFLLGMIVATGIYIAMVIVWIEWFYGRYACQIKDVLHELREDTES